MLQELPGLLCLVHVQQAWAIWLPQIEQSRTIPGQRRENSLFLQDDQMFMAEIGVMRKLSHPYIIRYLGCGMMTQGPKKGSSEDPQSHIAIVCPQFPSFSAFLGHFMLGKELTAVLELRRKVIKKS